MNHIAHAQHPHVHSSMCEHTAILHNGHIDYLHDDHLHASHEGHYDEHALAVNTANPAECAPTSCSCEHQSSGHETVPHGDHQDYLYQGMLHHPHSDHCDNHGPVAVQ